MHKRVLRLGDPLSPMLFDIAVDVLQKMLQAANIMHPLEISNKISYAAIALHYADDTDLISCANELSLVTTSLVLGIFSRVLRLTINYSKSCFIPFNLVEEQSNKAALILRCEPKTLPVTYLGMPLTISSPAKVLFLPLIEKVERKLEGWKGKLISRGGRLQLINVVLSSIPVYFMTCFKLLRWVVKRINKIK